MFGLRHSERTGPQTPFSLGVVSEESAVVFLRHWIRIACGNFIGHKGPLHDLRKPRRTPPKGKPAARDNQPDTEFRLRQTPTNKIAELFRQIQAINDFRRKRGQPAARPAGCPLIHLRISTAPFPGPPARPGGCKIGCSPMFGPHWPGKQPRSLGCLGFMDIIWPLKPLFLSDSSLFHFSDLPVAAPPRQNILSTRHASSRSGDF